jgi:hypothetical protein
MPRPPGRDQDNGRIGRETRKKPAACLFAGALALAAPFGAARALTAEQYQNANVWTGAGLAQLCAATADGALGTGALNLCHGFARGAIAADLQIEAASRRKTDIFCLPTASPASANAVLGALAGAGAGLAGGLIHDFGEEERGRGLSPRPSGGAVQPLSRRGGACQAGSGVKPASRSTSARASAGLALSMRSRWVSSSAATVAAGSASFTALAMARTQPPQVMSGTRNVGIAGFS